MLKLYVSRAGVRFFKPTYDLLAADNSEGTTLALSYCTRCVSPDAVLREGEDVYLYAEDEEGNYRFSRLGTVLNVESDEYALHIRVRLINPWGTWSAEPPTPYFVQ